MANTIDDVEAIKKLKAQYFYFLDTKQWDNLRTLFTPDADFDSAREGSYTFDGLAGFITGASASLQSGISVHHGHMPIIDFGADGEATGIWAMSDYVDLPDVNRTFVGYGHYHERYRRVAGVWKICNWKITRLRVDNLNPRREL